MDLIARIDAHGRCFVGRSGVDDFYVKDGMQSPVTIVRNDEGGEVVTPEEIAHACANHKRHYVTYFADDEVKGFFENYEQHD